ncbi:polysaccharide biosynthesis protein [Ekhidna lutea]|uniref:polysaccharide biosynthesis protein n=1 Tax=Ekhidna lutea TaxID=447679 RepID=UPI000B79AB54|nr:polysaccharide biosynthesis protein [Ekhidna lutea]
MEAEEIFKKENKNPSRNLGVVKLGNTIGARGSVFEPFKKQGKSGILKLTHPEATRFCISQSKAANFILKALKSQTEFIETLKMKAFKVIELARDLAPGCSIEISGLRPGGRLYEEIDGNSSKAIQELKL